MFVSMSRGAQLNRLIPHSGFVMGRYRHRPPCYLTASVILFALMGIQSSSALNNGLGLTPQMGWNSWNHFGCSVSEELIRDTALEIKETGLDKFGYTHVIIDDCWAELERSSSMDLVARQDTFPSGLKNLADFVHSLGLKLGIYSDAGLQTCSGQPGSLNFEERDAQSFADWGIDYLKYDDCHNNGIDPRDRYPPIRDALNKTGRPIFFSLCEWGDQDPATWAESVGNGWRNTGDINDSWPSMKSNAEVNDLWAAYAGPGGWNDPDMLEVGNDNMTYAESRAHFSIWAMIKAPLILGNDLRNMTYETWEIISNAEVISVNQDLLGVQGKMVCNFSTGFDVSQVWAGPLSANRVVVALWNLGSSTTQSTAQWTQIGFPQTLSVRARDLWQHRDLPDTYSTSLTVSVEPHGVEIFILSPVSV